IIFKKKHRSNLQYNKQQQPVMPPKRKALSGGGPVATSPAKRRSARLAASAATAATATATATAAPEITKVTTTKAARKAKADPAEKAASSPTEPSPTDGSPIKPAPSESPAETADAGPLAEGSHLPATLPTLASTSTQIHLPTLSKTTGLVLFLYPRASTPGCTTQACFFRDAHPQFKSAGYTVLGLSRDTEAAQKKFKEKHGMGFELLSDVDGAIIKAFGMGKGATGVNRGVVVVEKGGKVKVVKKCGPKESLEVALESVGVKA
ncbi:hypothetical protein HK104_001609, partial [Borealophlyctis nickersoniae]